MHYLSIAISVQNKGNLEPSKYPYLEPFLKIALIQEETKNNTNSNTRIVIPKNKFFLQFHRYYGYLRIDTTQKQRFL